MGYNYFQEIGISVTLLILLMLPLNGSAQVGIGTTDPDSNALLELDATDTPGGLLMPRVELAGTDLPMPLSAHVPGMTVYNTAAAGADPTAVSPGYYYNNGGQWVRIATDSDAKNNWNLTGNSDTDPTVNFLGTKDLQPLLINTNGNERMRVLANGRIAINRTTAISNTRLTVRETGGNRAIFGNSASGEGIRGEATSGDGVVGVTNTGFGVWGASLQAGYGGHFAGQNTNAVGALIKGGNQTGLEFPNSGTGAAITGRLYGSTSMSTANNSIGLAGAGDNLSGIPLSRPLGIGVLGYGYQAGVFGDSGYYGQTGVHGSAEGNPSGTSYGTGVFGENVGGLGDGVFGNSSNVGVRGYGVHGAILESGLNDGYGTIAWNTTNSGANRTGLIALGQNLNPLTFSGTGAVLYGQSSGGAGFAENVGGTGLIGVGNNISTASLAANGSGVAGTGNTVGMYGYANQPSDGIGVVGVGNDLAAYTTPPEGAGVAGTGVNIGVFGHATDASGFGIYSEGDLHATDNITAGGDVSATGDVNAGGTKNFIIDDPRDPANKYLKHASIESNEILNLYRGVSTFDASGEIVVQLPDYYDAINKNASYQLTPIGAAMPNLFIAEEVSNGSFKIAGGVASKKVSWTITAERNDPYIRSNPEIRNMTVDKGVYRGRYLAPEAYGQPADRGILNNREGKVPSALTPTVAKQNIVAQEMHSQTIEATKLDRVKVQNLITPFQSRRNQSSETKEKRDIPLEKAEKMEVSPKVLEQEGQNTSGIEPEDTDTPVKPSKTEENPVQKEN